MNKFVFCGDENLYNRFHEYFLVTDEFGYQKSYFDRNIYDFYHLNNRDYINLIINPLNGITNTGDVLIQKSWYTNKQMFAILSRFKLLHPDTNVIVCMDVSLKKFEVFMSEVVSRELGFIAISEEEVEELFANNFQIYQEQYVLPKVKHKQIKKMLEN